MMRHAWRGGEGMSDNIRVIELRTHGVSGTPPESMLDARMVVQVGGDDRGRFFQACDVLGNARPRVDDLVVDGRRYTRYREGYHWGKMTSGGLKQALWAVLLPFALVNLGQWMVPPTSSAAGNRAVAVLRGLVRSIGIALTVLIMVQLTVIAEGVQTEDQAQALHQLGCQEAQGFLYSKALPASQFFSWLKAR